MSWLTWKALEPTGELWKDRSIHVMACDYVSINYRVI